MKSNSTSHYRDATAHPNTDPIRATVVSVIIRDFIQLTERLPPAKLADLMSNYYAKVCTQVEQQQGILTSISNFSMVVTFAEVESADVHARRALRCALMIAMIAHQIRFWIRQEFPDQGLDKFGVGIGVHSGELIFAEFGLPPHVQLVASGHAVSIAFLLAGKSKELDWSSACSQQTIELAGQGVKTKQSTLIGADWLQQPISAAEVVVVRDEENTDRNRADESLETTIDLKLDFRTGRHPVFYPAKFAMEGNNAAEFPTIPGYRFLRPIGRGGMSSVFLVERKSDGANLALKFADGSVSEDSDMLYSFVEEYGLLEQVHHPNVLQIYDQGVTDDALFILMEYLPGGTLKQQIGNSGIPAERAWKVLHEMAKALVEIHRVGIVHRDIKPENIMMRSDGAAVLGDFGVARRIIKSRNQQMDYLTGTPYFMSPEQTLGDEEDERTDIYSMGAVFFNMLTGKKPYLGKTLDEILLQHQRASIPKLPQQYLQLQPLLEQMMAKDRKQRYTSKELLGFMDKLQVAP